MTLAGFVNSLEFTNNDPRQVSVVRAWAKKLYVHIDQNISPSFAEHAVDVTETVANRLFEHLQSQDCASCPIPFQISQLKDSFADKKKCVTFSGNKGLRDSMPDSFVEFGSESQEFNATILIGILSPVGSIKKSLYISDVTGRILCHMLKPTADHLHSVVLIENWRFIATATYVKEECDWLSNGFLECYSEPVILYQKSPINSWLNCSSMVLKQKTGVVSQVSSCLRMKDWNYLVTIVCAESKIAHVYIHEQTFAFWISCITRGTKVSFTGLRKRRMDMNQKFFIVWCPTTSSKLIILGHPLSCIDDSASLGVFKTSLHLQFQDVNLLDPDDMNRGMQSVYVGEITALLSSEFGIFSLDSGKVILYCMYSLCEDLGCALRPGAVVIITKAHVFENDSTTHLVCCSRSSVSIGKHSNLLALWHPVRVAFNIFLHEYQSNEPFYQHPLRTLSVVKLVSRLVELFPFLSTQSLLSISKRDKKYSSILPWLVFRGGLHTLISEGKSIAGTKNFERNRYFEVLGSPHSCFIFDMLEKPASPFMVLSLSELKARSYTKISCQECPNDVWWFYILNDEDLKPHGEETMSWDDTLILLGMLQGNRNSGRLQISDSTDTIDCLLIQSEDSPLNILCTEDAGCMVRILKFQVVVESLIKHISPNAAKISQGFTNSREIYVSSSIAERSNIMYLTVNASDIEVLHRPAQKNNIYEDFSLQLGCHACNDKSGIDKTMPEITSSSSGSLRHNAETLKRSHSEITRENCQVNICYILLTNFSVSTFLAHGFFISNQPNVKSCSGSFVKVKLDFSHFRQLEPFLFRGMIIKITSPHTIFPNASGNIFIDPSYNVQHFHNEKFDELPKLILDSIDNKWKNCFFARMSHKALTISELFVRHVQGIVLVKGVVSSKVFYVERNVQRLRLDVRSDEMGKSLSVYMGKVSVLPYSYGVLPGSFIVLQNITVVVSAKGNVYAKFGIESSIVVTDIPHSDTKSSERDVVSGNSSETNSSQIKQIHQRLVENLADSFKSSDNNEIASTCDNKDSDNLSSSGMHAMKSFVPDNVSTISYKAEPREIVLRYIFDLYDENQGENLDHDIVKLAVFCDKILNVDINLLKNQQRQNLNPAPDPLQFSAKCIVEDYTGRAFLHFDSADKFFRFIEVPSEAKEEFLKLCEKSEFTNLSYDSLRHNVKSSIIDCTDKKQSESQAFNYLIYLCNNFNGSVAQAKEVSVRRHTFNAKNDSLMFKSGTFGVGSRGQGQMLSKNLKLLHFSCLEVI